MTTPEHQRCVRWTWGTGNFLITSATKNITAADALAILKTFLCINTIAASWVFVPADAGTNPNLAAMSRSSVSYKDEFNLSSITSPVSASVTGILLGDVNNSWLIPT
ncbi:MAG: hypothetical protein ACKVQK_25820 [Burkholderiales bacterium]